MKRIETVLPDDSRMAGHDHKPGMKTG